MRRLFTAGTDDTVRCKHPPFQSFPSGKEGRERRFLRGLCRLPGGDGAGNGGVRRPGDGGGLPRGGVPAGSTASLSPAWAAGLF